MPVAGRQFNMRDLLMFMFACSVYLAMLASLRAAFASSTRLPALPVSMAVPGAFVVLGIVYCWWGPRHALIVHFSGPLLVGGLTWLLGFMFIMSYGWKGFPVGAKLSELLEVAHFAMLLGCGLGTLVSFPTAAFMLLHLAFLQDDANRPPPR